MHPMMTTASSSPLFFASKSLLLSGVVLSILVIFIDLSTAGQLHAPPSSSYLCKRMSKPDYQSTLVGALYLLSRGERLLLFDAVSEEDYLVYEVPPGAVKSSQLDISAVEPVPIEEYWPDFNRGDGDWKRHVKQDYQMFYPIYRICPVEQSHHQFVIIDSVPKGDGHDYKYGLVYQLDFNKTVAGRAYQAAVEQTITSAKTPDRVYSLSGERVGQVTAVHLRTWLNRYWDKEQGHDDSCYYHGKVDHGMNRDCYKGELNERYAAESGHLYYLVKKDTKEEVEYVAAIKRQKDGSLQPEDFFSTRPDDSTYKDYRLKVVTGWGVDAHRVPFGYLNDGHFTLFTPTMVVVFEDSMAGFFDNVFPERYNGHGGGEVQEGDYKITASGIVGVGKVVAILPHCRFLKCPDDDMLGCKDGVVTPTPPLPPITYPNGSDVKTTSTSAADGAIVVRLPTTSATLSGLLLYMVVLIVVLAVLLVVALIIYFFCLGEGRGGKDEQKKSKEKSKEKETTKKEAASKKKKQQQQPASKVNSSFQSAAYSKDGGGSSQAPASKVQQSKAQSSAPQQSKAPQSKAEPPKKNAASAASTSNFFEPKNKARTHYATSFNETSVNKVP